MIERIEDYKIGIIGGGRRCRALLQAIYSEPDVSERPQVLAVADPDEKAVGLAYARDKGIFTTTDYREILSIEDIELIFELTPDDSLKSAILDLKPAGILLVDHHAARALLDKLQIRGKFNEIRQQLGSGQDRAVQLLEAFHDFVTQINDGANAYAEQTRENLLTSEATLSQIIDGSTIPTFVIDRNHRVLHWNRACERLTGLPAHKVLGTDQHWKAFREEKRPIMADLILDSVDDEELWRLYASKWSRSDLISGGVESEEFFPKLGAGGTWLFFTAAPIKDRDGEIIGAIETLQDRTRQKNAEIERERKNRELAAKVEELRENRQAMYQIINGSTIPTFVIDQDHKISHWNKALERLTGFDAKDMIGTSHQWKPFYKQERPSMADVILDQVDEAQLRDLYGGKWRRSALIDGGWEAEAFFPNLGDGGKWIWFTAAPITSPDGRVAGAIETLWDKTEEHKSAGEQERHTQELATFCSVYATLSGPLSLQDRIKESIKEVADIFQIDAICLFQLRPDGRFYLKHSYGHADILCFHNRVAEEGSLLMGVAKGGKTTVYKPLPMSDDHETRLLNEAGLGSMIYIPIFDRNKSTIAVIRAGSKSTDHFGNNEIRSLELIANRMGVAIENSLLEEDIRRQVNFQARLIGSSNDGIVATDDQWRVVVFNPMAETIFGLKRDEVIGRMDARTFYPRDIVEAFGDLSVAGSGTGNLPWREITLVSRQNEDIPVRFSGALLREKHKVMGCVSFFHDLREIKRLEKELLGAERLAAIGQTVAGMAHCVKNILHGFKGGSYILNQGIEKDNPEKLQAGWQMVQRNINRTSGLVQDLLSYSKERDPEPEACEPNDIVSDVCDLMGAVAEEHAVEIRRHLDPGLGEVVLDPRSLHRSLMNLVSNGIDACRDDDVPDKKHWVLVTTAVESGDWIRFSVQDNGSGMSEDVRSKLFTSFFSTKGVQGTGLGLLVTGKLIEEHHGTIEVESRLGEGSTFTLRLPLKSGV
ncbi:MAG: PAS domain-containing protein [Desulfobacteraceae bacterium]|nr:PAS domain-containing protein [Desulfobacteraceae bacterium]